MTEYTPKVKTFVSNRTYMLDEKVNEFLQDITKRGCIYKGKDSSISWTDNKGYQVLCQIEYLEPEEEQSEQLDIRDFDYGIDFGAGMSFDGGPSND